ncbi:peroxide stress protein YaaA [uncultured Rhodoferax sp.]|uniref:peroxide stress protein YaaA n=1 Tax=uncultured Rhodoferax sp. TaxID=223188 RepID=UPI0025E6312F|nr:peroxide stress protein YaaA [uncultured Rhodoferax sp.]
MLFLLSPAKSLDYDTPLNGQPHSAPLFVKQSKALITLLREYTPAQISGLMDLSDKLAALNVARYAAWSTRATQKNARQAALAFDGDVYDGLQAKTLGIDDLAWAQEHLCILSGLYGVLRPLDLMQPYRLEMGTALQGPHGSNLYHFWGSQIADYLNTRLRKDASPVIVNLASNEYFKSVDRKALKGRVVECVFQEYKDGQYKVISFFAKKARGLMARYAIEHRLLTPEQLKGFDSDGYAYAAAESTPERLVFRRNKA